MNYHLSTSAIEPGQLVVKRVAFCAANRAGQQGESNVMLASPERIALFVRFQVSITFKKSHKYSRCHVRSIQGHEKINKVRRVGAKVQEIGIDVKSTTFLSFLEIIGRKESQ